MTTAYGADRQALTRHLLWLMAAAAHDLSVPGPAKLYRRFVAWALPTDARCRVCGSRRDDVVPDLPPRLFPCNEEAIPPIHLPGEW